MNIRTLVAVAARTALAAAPVVAWDVVGVAGAGLVVYGVSLVYQPAAYIIGGAMLLSAAWLHARRG